MAKTPQEFRYDQYGQMRLMAEAEGYILARRKGSTPFCITRREWDELPKLPFDTDGAGPNVHRLADYRKP